MDISFDRMHAVPLDNEDSFDTKLEKSGNTPPHSDDVKIEIERKIDEVCTYYKTVAGLSNTDIDELRAYLQKTADTYLTSKEFSMIPSIVAGQDTELSEHSLSVQPDTRFSGIKFHDPAYLDMATKSEQCHTLDILLEFAAVGHTGIIAPSEWHKAESIAYDIRPCDLEAEKEGRNAQFSYYQRIGKPQRISQAHKDFINQTTNRILAGDILLCAVDKDFSHNGNAGAYATQISIMDGFGFKNKPIIYMPMHGESPYITATDDSSDVRTMLHEAAHADDFYNGMVMGDPETSFLTEYRAFYEETHIGTDTVFDSKTMARYVAENMDSLYNNEDLYGSVTEEIHCTQNTPLKERALMIHKALTEGKDISPELAKRIVQAGTDEDAVALIASVDINEDVVRPAV